MLDITEINACTQLIQQENNLEGTIRSILELPVDENGKHYRRSVYNERGELGQGGLEKVYYEDRLEEAQRELEVVHSQIASIQEKVRPEEWQLLQSLAGLELSRKFASENVERLQRVLLESQRNLEDGQKKVATIDGDIERITGQLTTGKSR